MNVELEVVHKEANYQCSDLIAKGCGELLMRASVGVKNDDNAVKVEYVFCPVCGLMAFTSCIWLEGEGD